MNSSEASLAVASAALAQMPEPALVPGEPAPRAAGEPQESEPAVALEARLGQRSELC